ncbi:MAG: hypothetical protein POELPBGB_01419 [Bacteroidia bacterium]|nr:hypothetical protein [Bacteroidia bacterium]
MKKLKLNNSIKFSLKPTSPFAFEGTFYKPSHFPTPDRKYSDNVYWQSLNFKNQLYGIKLKSIGTTAKPNIEGTLYYNGKVTDKTIEEIKNELSFRFDLNANLSEMIDLGKRDDLLTQAMKTRKGMRVCTPYSLYEFLVITTVLQNTTVRRSVQMMNNLFTTYGTLLKFDDVELYGFWNIDALNNASEEDLRNLKLGYRAKIFKKQAEMFLTDKYVTEKLRTLSKENLRKTLLAIYGVGPASVQYLLFEVFHFYDACEFLPPWEQKIYSQLLFSQDIVDSEKILKRIHERWGKWKMLAMHYIFEDLFWRHKQENIPWLKQLIRL